MLKFDVISLEPEKKMKIESSARFLAFSIIIKKNTIHVPGGYVAIVKWYEKLEKKAWWLS